MDMDMDAKNVDAQNEFALPFHFYTESFTFTDCILGKPPNKKMSQKGEKSTIFLTPPSPPGCFGLFLI